MTRGTETLTKTFVLGAGFSASAGFPLVRVLKDQVIHLAQRTPYKVFFRPGNRGFEKGQFYAGLEMIDPADSLQFEEILIALGHHLENPRSLDPCHTTLKVLKSVCARVMWKFQNSIQELSPAYGNFALWADAISDSQQHSAIVSFNWDLVAERALTDSAAEWNYSDSDDGSIPILKPHGSINWNRYLKRNLKAEYDGWKPVGPGSRLSYDSLNPLSDPDRDDINPDLHHMIFPGDPELATEDADLELLWRWTAEAISTRESIVFIGYSLPHYDSFSVEFFSNLCKGKTIEVYNPSKEHLENFRYVFGNQAILEPSKFEECKYARRED